MCVIQEPGSNKTGPPRFHKPDSRCWDNGGERRVGADKIKSHFRSQSIYDPLCSQLGAPALFSPIKNDWE